MCLSKAISYPNRVVKLGSLSRGYALHVAIRFLSPPLFLPSSVYRKRNETYRCINQAEHVDRSNKGWKNGNGRERGEKSLKVDVEFRREEKNWKEKEGEAESAKIYVHAQGHGYRDRADGGWNRRGNRLILRASYVVSTLAEEFGRRLRPAEERSGTGRGPGGRVEQRLPN